MGVDLGEILEKPKKDHLLDTLLILTPNLTRWDLFNAL